MFSRMESRDEARSLFGRTDYRDTEGTRRGHFRGAGQLLSPQIVEAILNGQQPRLLDLNQLLDPFPIGWDDQRRHFGFDHSSF